MPLYLCRWQNGDCSILAARDRDAAIDLLDHEIGDAEGLPLLRLENDLLLNLRLRDDGDLELDREQPMSSDLHEEVMHRAYPILDEALNKSEGGLRRRKIREAVGLEKRRVRGAKVIAGTLEGRRVQKLGNVPASKADRIVRQALPRRVPPGR